MLDKPDQDEISKTAVILGIPQAYIHKDFYLTKAIHALAKVQNDYFDLIFQGSTSLSKGYKIIKRLSEDSDFRVAPKEAVLRKGKKYQTIFIA